MYRRNVVTSLFKSPGTTPLLSMNRRPFSSAFQLSASSARTSASSTLLPEKSSELLLPSPVKYIERSTLMITKDELETYFYPLFRRGWELKRLGTDDDSCSASNHESPFLVRKFRFKGNRSTRAFLQEIFRMESEEKHHISFNLWSEKRPVIKVMTQTHSSRRFDQNLQIDVIEPGLSLRDIRIAVLIENLLDNPNNLIARVLDESEEYCDTDRAAAWQILLSQYP